MSIDWSQALEKFAEPLHFELECGIPPIVGKITWDKSPYAPEMRQFIVVWDCADNWDAQVLAGSCYEFVGSIRDLVDDVGLIVLYTNTEYKWVWHWRWTEGCEFEDDINEVLQDFADSGNDVARSIPAPVWSLRHCQAIEILTKQGGYINVQQLVNDHIARANQARADCAAGLCLVVQALGLEQHLPRPLIRAIVLLAAPWVTPAGGQTMQNE